MTGTGSLVAGECGRGKIQKGGGMQGVIEQPGVEGVREGIARAADGLRIAALL